MAKLRHIAMCVGDVPGTAKFYEEVFGMRRVEETHELRALLTDGVVTLALVDNSGKYPPVKGYEGLHHIGFVVEDVPATLEKITSRGGGPSNPDEGQRPDQSAPVMMQYHDLNNVNLDVVNEAYSSKAWRLES